VNIDRLRPDTKIGSPISAPIFRKAGEKAVLLIHGYTGSPHDMCFLADYLNTKGMTVHVPRLPGHGTNSTDFDQSNWNQWLRASIDSYIHLSTDYQNPMICGLSMGGLLAVILASIFQPPKIVLAAPAFGVKSKILGLTPILKWIVPNRKRDEGRIPIFPDNPDLEHLSKEYWSTDNLKKLSDLERIRRIAIRRLPKVRSETLTILSKKDRTVSLKTSDIIEHKIGASRKQTIILENSAHVVVNDCEREEVACTIAHWFS